MAQNSSPSQDLGNQEAPARQHDTSKDPQAPPTQSPANAEKASPTEATSSALVLGPGDEVDITVYGAPDLSGHTRVSGDGNISMPLIGYIRVAGLSSSEAEGEIEAQLRQHNIVNDPQVSIYAKEFTSSGISVAGEVAKPGFYSALGPHRLFDVLQAAGGLSERASGSVTISHKGDAENPVKVELSQDPAEMVRSNVELHPGDTVFAARAPMVYVLGEVNKPGGYVLNSTGAMTVLRVVAAAGGPTRAAVCGAHEDGAADPERVAATTGTTEGDPAWEDCRYARFGRRHTVCPEQPFEDYRHHRYGGCYRRCYHRYIPCLLIEEK